ncbi:MAG: hypothetical protein KDC93_05440 [Cyclobacteriaceae bacterium]|nr:hypothetical protein [Cyclobacteriaceae bacterium]
MELRDLIVTPIIIFLVYAGAYWIRPRVTDSVNRRYFIPALTVRIIGALAVGFLYQFYYGGGDTFNFHTHGSRHVWEAFIENPIIGIKLLLSDGTYSSGTYNYASKIIFYGDSASYFIVKVASIFDLITFSSYSATAVLFAVLSFVGSWLLFLAFYKRSQMLIKWQAVSILFIPSVIFWGSGLMKDTLTFMAVGFLTYSVGEIFITRKFLVIRFILLLTGLFILFNVKKYILLCYLPAALLWVFAGRLARIRSLALKVLIMPIIAFMLILCGYYSIILVGKDDPRYAIDRLAATAKITAYDIGFYTGRDAGSGYSLGELDGTLSGMFYKIPQAINVSLFRPYIWEIRNPLMLLSAIESFVFTILTLYVLIYRRSIIIRSMGDPIIVFCLVFSLTFAFAVGISTFNFGTLARYKIPMLPFYALSLGYILNYSKRERKVTA